MEEEINTLRRTLDDAPVGAAPEVAFLARSLEDKKATDNALRAKVLTNGALLKVLEEGQPSGSQNSPADDPGEALEAAKEKLEEATGKLMVENLGFRRAIADRNGELTAAAEAADIAPILTEIQIVADRVAQIEVECAKRKAEIWEQIAKFKQELQEYVKTLPPPVESEVEVKVKKKLKRVSFIQQLLRQIIVRNCWLLADDKYLALLEVLRHPVTLENVEAVYHKVVDVSEMFTGR